MNFQNYLQKIVKVNAVEENPIYEMVQRHLFLLCFLGLRFLEELKIWLKLVKIMNFQLMIKFKMENPQNYEKRNKHWFPLFYYAIYLLCRVRFQSSVAFIKEFT